MENSNKKIASKDSSDKTIRRKRSEANATVSLPKPITNSSNQFPQRPLHLKTSPHPSVPPTQHSCLTKSLIQDDTTTSTQTATPHNTVDIGRCLEILLQHNLPEDLARSLVKDAADVVQLINTIQTEIPGANDLLCALGELKNDEFSQEDRLVPKHKLPWLHVLLQHGLPKHIAAPFIRDIVGGVPELAEKLHEAMSGDADVLLKKVVSGRVIGKNRNDLLFHNHHSHSMHRDGVWQGVV